MPPPPRTPRFIVPASTAPSSTPSRPPRFIAPHPTTTPSRHVPQFLSAPAPPTAPTTATPTPAPRPTFVTPALQQPQEEEEVIDDFGDFGDRRRRKRRRPSSSSSYGEGSQDEDAGLESPTAHRSTRALPFAPGSTQSAGAGYGAGAGPMGPPISSRLFALRLPEGEGEVHLPVDWSPTKPKRGRSAYVPQGLAATVAGWAVDARNAQGRRGGATYRVVEARPGEGYVGVVTEEGGLLLVRRVGAGEVGVDVRVKVEWPWWEVGIEGGMWKVCVFWEVVGEEEEEMLV